MYYGLYTCTYILPFVTSTRRDFDFTKPKGKGTYIPRRKYAGRTSHDTLRTYECTVLGIGDSAWVLGTLLFSPQMGGWCVSVGLAEQCPEDWCYLII
jgi:hypothetical protein